MKKKINELISVCKATNEKFGIVIVYFFVAAN